jgi:nitrogen-specific signal transduction histidine kinase
VKRLIDLLEGSIQVTSTQQQTHFTIELPDLKGRSLPQEWSEG